jgi:hypothetical protein
MAHFWGKSVRVTETEQTYFVQYQVIDENKTVVGSGEATVAKNALRFKGLTGWADLGYFDVEFRGEQISCNVYSNTIVLDEIVIVAGKEKPPSRPVPKGDPDAGNPSHELCFQSRGKLVEELQRLLNIWPEPKASLAVTGVFDKATEAAVIAFQKAQSPPLPPPPNQLGWVEQATWKRLRSLYGQGGPGGGKGGRGPGGDGDHSPPDLSKVQLNGGNEHGLANPPAMPQDPELTPNILERLRKEVEWAALLGLKIQVQDVSKMSLTEKVSWILHYVSEFMGAAIVDEAEGMIRSLGAMAGGAYSEVMKHPELLTPAGVPVYLVEKLVENREEIRKRLAASKLVQTLLKPDVLIAMTINPMAGISLMAGHLVYDFYKEIDNATTGEELVKIAARLAHMIGGLFVQLILAILTEGVAAAASEVVGGVRAASGLAKGLEAAEAEEAAALAQEAKGLTQEAKALEQEAKRLNEASQKAAAEADARATEAAQKDAEVEAKFKELEKEPEGPPSSDARAAAAKAAEEARQAEEAAAKAAAEAKQAEEAAAKAAEEARKAEEAAAAAEKEAAIKKKMADLKNEGHGPQRHEGDVTDQQLDRRARLKEDPETGTRQDAYKKNADGTPKNHSCGDSATRINSEESYVKGEEYSRNSQSFKDQAAANEPTIAVETPLEDVYGPDYKNEVAGRTRSAPWPNTTAPTTPTDFTDGTLVSVYRRQADGTYKLLTMYPEPK